MYCRYCGKELPEDSNYCPNCGKRQKENFPERKVRMPQFINGHKKLSYAYLAWVLVHIALFLFSSPKGHRYVYGDRRDYDLSDGFYPFNKSVGDIIDGKSYNLSFIDNIDVYDFSELFFYTILIPLVIVGLTKSIPFVTPFFKKIRENYNKWQENNTKKREEYQGNIAAFKAPQKEDLSQKSVPVNSAVDNVVSHVQEEIDEVIDELDSSMEKLPQEENPQDEAIPTEAAETEVKIKKMPLFTRFIGTIIDKILILVIFVVGSIAISPYGAAGRLGTYVGLRNTPLSLYEYLDKSQMNRYGTYYEGISKGYQDLARLETDPPHIGSTLELDMNITFTFIILNLIFYILFESILSASPGKRMLGGVILDSADEKIGFDKALIRGLCGGALMAGTYFLLHLQGGLINTVVVVVFFLLLDLPVLFTKKSLLDLLTGTTYTKRK